MNDANPLGHNSRLWSESAAPDAALQPVEQLFWATFNSSPAAQLITELATGRVLAANEAYCRLVGYPLHTLLGHTTPELHIWLDLEERADVLRELQRSGHVRDKEFKIRTSTGAVRTQLASFELSDLQGKSCVVSSTIDITERKQAEEALRRSEERFRTAFDYMLEGAQIIGFDWRYLYLNDTAQTHSRRPKEELLGNRYMDMWPGSENTHVFAMMKRCLEDRIPCRMQNEFVYPDGLVRWFELSIQPIPEGIFILSIDITERKQAETDLVELNRTLEERIEERAAEVQDLYENAPAGYHSLDANGRFVRINQTELNWLGCTREEVLGRPFLDFVTPASQAVFRANFPHFLATGRVRDLEFDLVRKDGTILSVLASATAIYDAGGRYLLSRSTLFDNSARKQADDALRLANLEMERAIRLKDQFLANMSHELRTPLTGMLALGENLQELIYGPLNERQLKVLGHIETSSRHLLSLINDLLDLSKIEAGGLELELQPVIVDDITQASLLFVKEMAHKKNIDLSCQIDQPHLALVADGRRLKQMLVNLLGNAVKFTPEGGRVQLHVTADPAAREIRFAVLDTGVGIPPEAQARLFQPFTQLDSALARQYEGSGLGLALVKRLAAQHGGSVSVASSGVPGEGSCFTIVLPYNTDTDFTLAM